MRSVPLTIILPVYNEGENVSFVINSIEKKVKTPHEILVVYDFDKDNTIPVVKKFAKKYKYIKLVKNNLGKGLLNAIKTGFAKAHGKVIVVMPADRADNPTTINKMYRKILSGADVVCATRYTKGGKKIGGEMIKTFISKVAGLSTPLVLGIPTTDLSNGFKMYKREIIDKIPIKSDGGWEFALELTIKAHNLGYKVSEVPSIWKDRIHGESKFKLKKWLPKYIYWYVIGVKYRITNNFLSLQKVLLK